MRTQNSSTLISTTVVLASLLLIPLSLTQADDGLASPQCPRNPAPQAIRFEKGVVHLTPKDRSKNRISLSAEFAQTPDQQRLGLMYRPKLQKNWAMVFRYAEPTSMGIWMKNTCAPLDLLFFDANQQLSKVVKNTVPFSLESHDSPGPISAVLEMAAGEVDRLGIQVGWTLTFTKTQKEK